MPYGDEKSYAFFKMKGSPMQRNFGTSPMKDTDEVKKAAKDFTVAQDNFDRGMLGSADYISAAKDRLDKELKVNGPKTQEALQEYLNAIDEATTPLDKKQFNIDVDKIFGRNI